jgi:lambda family phage tail tape measure protein
MSTPVGINVQVTSTGTQQVTVQLNNIGAAATRSANAVDFMQRALNTLIGAAALNTLKQYIDLWASFEGNINVATKSADQAAAVQERLFAIAQKTRQPLQDVGNTYQRIAIQSDALGLSQNQVLKITQALGEALVVQHTTVAQASGALLQYSQALGTGKVRAQEWNSVLTGLPVLAKAIAEQLGKPVAAVKAMISSGALTSQMLAKATIDAEKVLNEQFGKSAYTIAQGFTVLKNSVVQWVGQTVEAVNGATVFGKALKFLGENIDTVAKSLFVAAAAYGAWRLATGGFAAIVGATAGAVRGLTAALAANPFAFVATAVVAAATALVAFRNEITLNAKEGLTLGDYLVSAWKMISDGAKAMWAVVTDVWSSISGVVNTVWQSITSSTGTFADAVLDVIKRMVNNWIGLYVGLYNAVKDIWNNFPEYFVGIFIDALNGAQQSTTNFINKMIDSYNVVGDKVGAHLDNIDFTPLENKAKATSLNIGKDFQDAFNTDYIGGFMQRLTAGAQAAAAARKKVLGDPGLDQTGTAYKMPDKANKALEKLQNQLRTLLNTIDPAAGAILQMAHDTDILDKALKAHLISQDQYQRYLQALKMHYTDIVHPQEAYLAKLAAETTLLEQDGDARIIATKVWEQEQALRKKSIVLNQSEIDTMTELIRVNLEATQIAAQRANIIQRTTQPQKDYNQSISALNQLYSQGTISADQFNQQLDEITLTFLNSQRTFQAGAQAGLIEWFDNVTNDAANVKTALTDMFDGANNALANFVTTGKLNFGDLMTSILQDLIKIELQILESNILKSLFGSGVGFAGAFGFGGGAGGASAANNWGVGNNSYGFTMPSGFAAGGYTGNYGVNDVAGVVHGQEYVLNSDATRRIGVGNLDAWNAGSAPSSGGGGQTVAIGGPKIGIVINNTASDQVQATASVRSDDSGNPQIQVMVQAIKRDIASDISKGRGDIHDSIQAKFGVKSIPGRG